MTINTIEEYLAAIKEIEVSLRKPLNNVVFYRGEDKLYDKVSSSLYLLKDKMRETIEQTEMAILEEAKTRFPEVVKECNDNIEMLIKYQHYSLPTRLLDVTANPLVALYFACHDYNADNCENGRVLICTKPITPYEFVQSIGELLPIKDLRNLKELSNISRQSRHPLGFSEKQTLMMLSNTITKPLLFRPPQDNARIKAQQGAFIFTPIKIWHGKSGNEFPIEKVGYAEVRDNEVGNLNTMFEHNFIVIPAPAKEQIIDQLDRIDVNEASLFQDEDHKMNYIKSHYIRFDKYNWKLDLDN